MLVAMVNLPHFACNEETGVGSVTSKTKACAGRADVLMAAICVEFGCLDC